MEIVIGVINGESTIYKKVRILKDGKVYPLFIDKKKPFLFNDEWVHCEFHPTNGFAERTFLDEDGNKIGCWHATYKPYAPHIADEIASGEKRVWMECLGKGQTKTYDRPESMGGTWALFEWIKPIRILTESEVQELNERVFE